MTLLHAREAPVRCWEREPRPWEGRHQSPWCEEVPETCSGHSTAMSGPAGHQEMANKKTIPFCNMIKGFFFSVKANLLPFVFGKRTIDDPQLSPELQSS